MEQIRLLKKDFLGMSKASTFTPKGRRSLPQELIQFGRHLVYSEGTKTEPYYVESIKNSISRKHMCRPNDIQIISVNKDGESYNTIKLFKYADSDVRKRVENGELIHHVWVFFDKDSFPKDDYDNAHKLIEEKNNSDNENVDGYRYDKETGICWHSCWSNECFELWIYLYFNYLDSGVDRKQYRKMINDIPSLKRIGFEYEKNLKDIHNILMANGGSIDKAINSAKKLEKGNGTSNPSTGVYKFAEFFREYMKD